MEVQQPSHPHKSGPGSSDAYRDKYQRYPATVGQIVVLEEEELLLLDSEALKLDQIEGLSLRMTQAMNHYCCFVHGATDHFLRDCPHWETFHAWYRRHLNSKGAGPQRRYLPQKVL